MKEIMLRRPRLEDFHEYAILYTTMEFQWLYSNGTDDAKFDAKDEERLEKLFWKFGFDINVVKEKYTTCTLEQFQQEFDNLYMVIVGKDTVSGYIYFEKYGTILTFSEIAFNNKIQVNAEIVKFIIEKIMKNEKRCKELRMYAFSQESKKVLHELGFKKVATGGWYEKKLRE